MRWDLSGLSEVGISHQKNMRFLSMYCHVCSPHYPVTYRMDTRKNFSWRAVLQWHSCPGSGGVTIPGGVPDPWRCGTEGCGQWARWGGVGLGLGVLEVFFNLSDSVILFYDSAFLFIYMYTHTYINICVHTPPYIGTHSYLNPHTSWWGCGLWWVCRWALIWLHLLRASCMARQIRATVCAAGGTL